MEGKCVCEGYADILRNALAMVGIDAKFTKGFCVHTVKAKDEYERNPKVKKFQTIKETDDGKVYIGEWHAWCKVKIDGKWYNADPTWDVPNIKHKEAPTHCLMSDDEIKENDKKLFFKGPECNDTMDFDKVKSLFDEKYIYIGSFKILRIEFIKHAIDDLRIKISRGTEKAKQVFKIFFQIFLMEKKKTIC